MKYEPIFLTYVEKANYTFSGWDFSFITKTGRIQSDCLPWSYASQLLPFISYSKRMLDMGTGGGEFLSLMRPLPKEVYATEGYKPNIPIAIKHLQPLGVKVVEIEDDSNLPFQDAYFDLVTNQHESFIASEVRRIMRDKGLFITQQVGGLDCKEINEVFNMPLNDEYIGWNLDTAKNEIKNADMDIIYSQEAFPIQRFYDVGALIYYLKAIPWQLPDFNVSNSLDQLYKIHTIIQSKGFFDVTQHRFIIKAIAK